MSHHTVLRDHNTIAKKHPMPYIPIRIGGNQHGNGLKHRSGKESPYIHAAPIFKAKKHDPL